MEGLLVWTPAMDSRRARFWKELLTVREARESLVTKTIGQVSLTQLKPMDFIPFEMTSTGFLLSPSATTASKWDTQFTHASLTLCPSSLTIHRESVWSGRPLTSTMAPESNIVVISAETKLKTISCFFSSIMSMASYSAPVRFSARRNKPIYILRMWDCTCANKIIF